MRPRAEMESKSCSVGTRIRPFGECRARLSLGALHVHDALVVDGDDRALRIELVDERRAELAHEELDHLLEFREGFVRLPLRLGNLAVGGAFDLLRAVDQLDELRLIMALPAQGSVLSIWVTSLPDQPFPFGFRRFGFPLSSSSSPFQKGRRFWNALPNMPVNRFRFSSLRAITLASLLAFFRSTSATRLLSSMATALASSSVNRSQNSK